MPWPALRRALETLIREVDAGALTGVSLHGTEGTDVRLSYTCRDPRHGVDLPGVYVEDDEFEEPGDEPAPG